MPNKKPRIAAGLSSLPLRLFGTIAVRRTVSSLLRRKSLLDVRDRSRRAVLLAPVEAGLLADRRKATSTFYRLRNGAMPSAAKRLLDLLESA